MSGLPRRGSLGGLSQAVASGTYQPHALNTVVLFGDSITANCKQVTGINTYYSTRGYWTWANALGLRHRLAVVNFAGVLGNTTTQMLARVQTDVVAFAPGWCVVEGGTNDVNAGTSAATIQSNLTAIYDALTAAGIRVVATTIPPRNGLTAGALLVQNTVNQWLKGLARSRKNFLLVDWTSRLADPATGAYLTGLDAGDGIHPSTKGAARMGRLLADTLAARIPPADQAAISGGDTATLTANPMMNGTGGTVGTGWTGHAANAWTASRGDANAITAVAEVLARADQVDGQWQQLMVTSAGSFPRLIQDITTGFAPGDSVFGQAEVLLGSTFTVTGTACRLALYCTDSSFVTLAAAYDFYLDPSDAFPTENRPNAPTLLRTPAITVPASTAHLQVFFEWQGAGSVAVARAEARKGA